MNIEEKIKFRNSEGSNLVRISKDFIVRLQDITNIELVVKHPSTEKADNTYPKYKVSLDKNSSAWNWCLISIADFEKYLKPFVLDITEEEN